MGTEMTDGSEYRALLAVQWWLPRREGLERQEAIDPTSTR